jgi:nucleotide-binding universal stress UspA family protein
VFKRILVAVDGSQTADQALQEAIKLAKGLQGRLRIVHAVDTVNIYMGVEFVDPRAIATAITQTGQEVLRKAEAVARQAQIPVETRLIVIGTHGRQGHTAFCWAASPRG